MISLRERLCKEPYIDGNSYGVAVLSMQGDVEFYNMSEILEETDLLNSIEAARGLWSAPSKFKEDYDEYEQMYYKIRDAGLNNEVTDVDAEFTERVMLPLFNDILVVLPRYIHLDEEQMYYVLTCFIIFSYFKDQFSYSPRIMLDAEYGAGKSAILDVMNIVTYRGHKCFRYTPPALIATITQWSVTALLDEGSKNLRNKETGKDLALILIGGFSRSDSRCVKMSGRDFSEVLPQTTFTATMCALLDDSPPDLIDRSFIIPMVKSDKVLRLKKANEEIETEYDEFGNTLPSLDTIRSKLHALKMLSMSLSVKDRGQPTGKGVVFAPFLRRAKRYLESPSDRGAEDRYAYGDVYGFTETPVISGRAEDVLLPFHAISMAAAEDRTLVQTFIENYLTKPEDFESTEATLILAIKDLVEQEINKTRLRSELDPPTWPEVRAALGKITTSMVGEQYREIRLERDAWEPYDIEGTKTLTAKIRRMKLSYRTGGSCNKTYFDADAKLFQKAFCSVIRSKGTREVKRYFGRVLKSC